ncbi:nuclear transport factor 2 family protein [Azospirillum sp. A29]|uniref:nuclear transport factor 2 family protein n=1 Tax=Azospirillum sp. A29 TaxID=3160606 RepID=UPI00367163E3
MMLLERYIAGWRAQDANAILATLTTDCVVIESFGPVYRGHSWVEQWVFTWLAENGCVLDWTIRDLQSLGDLEIAEWTFRYTLRGEERTFDGATIAKLRDGKISYLREYATTDPLYDWRGEWKSI